MVRQAHHERVASDGPPLACRCPIRYKSRVLAVGIDIGGTTARAAIVDGDTGSLVASAKDGLAIDRSPQSVADTVVTLIERVNRGHDVRAAPVGVGLAGMLSGRLVRNAPNLSWRDVPFADLLEARLNRQVVLVNDLSAAAWGELKAGAARGAQDSLTVFVGTGVGAAMILGGRLIEGASGLAGELGHLKVALEGGRRCGCGELGCLEAYAGGANLVGWMREVGLEGTPADLERRALEGEERAKAIYDCAAGHLGLTIANQVTLLSPAVLVLGGGVLTRCPGLVERITRTVQARTIAPVRQGLRISMAELGDDSGIVGAALLGLARAGSLGLVAPG